MNISFLVVKTTATGDRTNVLFGSVNKLINKALKNITNRTFFVYAPR